MTYREETMGQKIRMQGYILHESRNAWRVVGDEPEHRGVKFNLREKRLGVWGVNWQTSRRSERVRVQFKADNLESALTQAEDHYFKNGVNPDVEPRISEVFAAWLESLDVRQGTIEDDYAPRTELFTKWCDLRGYRYWSDIHPNDLQDYADSFKRTHTRSSIERLCRVVRRASQFAARKFRGFDYEPFDIKLPKGKKRVDKNGKPRKRVSLRLIEGVEFLAHVRKQQCGWNTLPGFALGILASLRVQEIRPLRWKSIDLKKGLVSIEGYAKSETSYRTIPICRLLLEILKESYQRQSPDPDDLVLPTTHKKDSYGQAFERYRDKWKSSLTLEPNGLRRTLPTEFFSRQWYGETLQVYRGHKPPKVSTLDWNHYLEFDQDGLIKLFKRDVTNKIDRVLKTRLEKWKKNKV
jgi:integrase